MTSEAPGNGRTENTKESKEYVQTYGKADENEDYGFFFFPNRERGKSGTQDLSFWGGMKDILKGRRRDKTMRCLMNKQRCIMNSAKIKLLLRALEAHGCPVDIDKHILCDKCDWRIAGGFDFFSNQLVMCENNVGQRFLGACCHVMAHELTHAFDNCRAKMDIRNVEHMACTEIRASNLLGCNPLNSFRYGDGNWFNVDNAQKNCVRREATESLLMGRNISREEALAVVDKVFEKCYHDMEPFGRRIRPGTNDEDLALKDGILYGYTVSKVEKGFFGKKKEKETAV